MLNAPPDPDGGAARRSIRPLFFLGALLLFALLFMSDDEALLFDDASTPKPPATHVDPRVPALRAIADDFSIASRGLLFPSNVSERATGAWSFAGAARPSWLRPSLGPNWTASFSLHTPRGAANLSFAHQEGTAALHLFSRSPFPEVPSMQDVVGGLTLYDGVLSDEDIRAATANSASANSGVAANTRKLEAMLKGVYAADAGVILLAGGASGGAVGIEHVSRVVDTGDAVPPNPLKNAAPGECDVFVSLRYRPVGFNGATAARADAAPSRWRAAQLQSRARAALDDESAEDFTARAIDQVGRERATLSPLAGWLLHGRVAAFVPARLRSVIFLLDAHQRPVLVSVMPLSMQQSGRAREVKVEDDDGVGRAPRGRRLLDDARMAASWRAALDVSDAVMEEEMGGVDALPERSGRALASGRGAGGGPTSYVGARFEPMFGYVVSPNCGFTINVSTTAVVYDSDALNAKVENFAFGLFVFGLGHQVATLVQLVTSSSPQAATRVSLVMVGTQAVIDSYVAFLLLSGGGIAPGLLSALIAPALVHFLLFAVLEMKFLFVIWKSREPRDDLPAGDANAAASTVCRSMLGFYGKLYAAMLLVLVIIFTGSAGALRLVIFIATSLWVPQIIHSAQHDSRHGLKPLYIASTVVTRLFPVLYFGACPENFAAALIPPETRGSALLSWRDDVSAFVNAARSVASASHSSSLLPAWLVNGAVSPALASVDASNLFWTNATFVFWVVVWQAVQVATLLLQSRLGWGPRWFVPYVYLPRQYDYHRAIRVVDGRVVPNSGDTAAWLRPAHGGVAAVDAGTAAPVPARADGENWLAFRARVFAVNARARAASVWEGGVFFIRGLVQLATDFRLAAERRLGHASAVGAPPGLTTAEKPPWYVAVRHAVGGWSARAYTRLPTAPGAGLDTNESGDGGARGGGGGGALHDVEEGISGIASGGVELAVGGRGDTTAAANSVVAVSSAATAPPPAPVVPVSIRSLREADLDCVMGDASPGCAIDCVICLSPVRFPLARREYLVTPCDHLFHTACLLPWLQQQTICPTCRAVLPELSRTEVRVTATEGEGE